MDEIEEKLEDLCSTYKSMKREARCLNIFNMENKMSLSKLLDKYEDDCRIYARETSNNFGVMSSLGAEYADLQQQKNDLNKRMEKHKEHFIKLEEYLKGFNEGYEKELASFKLPYEDLINALLAECDTYE